MDIPTEWMCDRQILPKHCPLSSHSRRLRNAKQTHNSPHSPAHCGCTSGWAVGTQRVKFACEISYWTERNITAVVDHPANPAAPIQAHSTKNAITNTKPNTALDRAWNRLTTLLCDERIDNAKLTPMKDASISDKTYPITPFPAAPAA
jgi:hypothetical protein